MLDYYDIRRHHLGELRDSGRAPKMNARRWDVANRIHAAVFVAADAIGPKGWAQLTPREIEYRLHRGARMHLGFIEAFLLKILISLIVEIVMHWIRSQATTFGWTPNAISGCFERCAAQAESCL